MWAMWRRSGGTSGWWSGWRPGWGWRWRFRAACRPPRRRRGGRCRARRWPASARSRWSTAPARRSGPPRGRARCREGPVGRWPPAVRSRSSSRIAGMRGCGVGLGVALTVDAAVVRPAIAAGCISAGGGVRSRRRWPSTTWTPSITSTSTTCRWSTARICRCTSPSRTARPRIGSPPTVASGVLGARTTSDARWRCRSTAAAGWSPAFRRVHGFTRPLLLQRPLRQGVFAGEHLADQLRARLQTGGALRLFVVRRRRDERVHLCRGMRLPNNFRSDAARDRRPAGLTHQRRSQPPGPSRRWQRHCGGPPASFHFTHN